MRVYDVVFTMPVLCLYGRTDQLKTLVHNLGSPRPNPPGSSESGDGPKDHLVPRGGIGMWFHLRRSSRGAGVIAVATMTSVAAFAATAVAAQAGPALPDTVTVSPANTPQLNATGTTEQVRQLVQCGATMYAVGTFTPIKRSARSTPGTTSSASARPRRSRCDIMEPGRQRHRQLDRLQRRQLRRRLHRRDVHLGERHYGGEHRRGQHLDRARWSPLSGTPRTARWRPCWWPATGTCSPAATSPRSTAAANPYFASLNPATGKDDGYLQPEHLR